MEKFNDMLGHFDTVPPRVTDLLTDRHCHSTDHTMYRVGQIK